MTSRGSRKAGSVQGSTGTCALCSLLLGSHEALPLILFLTPELLADKLRLLKISIVYVNKNQFESGGAKSEVFRSAPGVMSSFSL